MNEDEKATHNAVNELITLRDIADNELAESERQLSEAENNIDELSHDRQDRTYAAMQVRFIMLAKQSLDLKYRLHLL